MKKFKPMLAASATIDDIQYPCLASPKIDGVRCIFKDGVALSRSLKPLPNKVLQSIAYVYDGLDGELFIKDFNTTASEILTAGAVLRAKFFAFDDVHYGRLPYSERLLRMKQDRDYLPDDVARIVPVRTVHNKEQAAACLAEYIKDGYEGAVFRNPDSIYKYGRSTIKQQGMLKIKNFADAEAKVIDVEQEHDIHGSPKGSLGALVVKHCETGVVFNIGTGFSESERKILWSQPPLGKLVKFKYLDCGIKTAPRHPVFLGFRDEMDL